MRIIYVAGPFRGKNAWEVEKNIRKAEEWSFELAKKGWMFICPHTNARFFDGTQTDEFWLEGTLELMRRCDAVFVCHGYKDSSGTLGEIKEAEKLGIPIFYWMQGTPYPSAVDLPKPKKFRVHMKTEETFSVEVEASNIAEAEAKAEEAWQYRECDGFSTDSIYDDPIPEIVTVEEIE